MTPEIFTCMDYTGLDPFTDQEVYPGKHLGDRKRQRALLPFFSPENDFEIRKTRLEANAAA